MTSRAAPAFLLLGCLGSLGSGACRSGESAADGAGGQGTGATVGDGSGTTGGTSNSGGTGEPASGGSDGSGSASTGSGGQDAETGGAASGGAPSAGGTGGEAPESSPGCGSEAPPAAGPRTIDIEGTEREYILTLPSDYDPDHPYRLIFGFHGAQYDAEWVAGGEEPLTGPYFGLEEEAMGSAIFVAGQALPGSWSNSDGRDLAYVQGMLEFLKAELCIDERRVFATGFSMGGIMTARVGCVLGDAFRAIAPMSPSRPSECDEGTTPVAYWSSHGTSDTSITPEQGEILLDEFLERNGCAETSVAVSPEGCVSYDGCSEGHPVSRCLFDGAHVPAPFAGTAIWAFFSQF